MCVCMRACVCMCAFAFVWHWWYVISIMEVFDAISQQHFKQSENTFATTTTAAAHTRRTHQFISALWLDIFILEISIPFVHLYTSLRICINYISTVVLCMEYKQAYFCPFHAGEIFFSRLRCFYHGCRFFFSSSISSRTLSSSPHIQFIC